MFGMYYNCITFTLMVHKEQYPIIAAHFDAKIAKLQNALLGLAIGTPALVITVMEILSQTL